MILMGMMTATTAMMMIISMGKDGNSRGSGLPGSGLPQDNYIGQIRQRTTTLWRSRPDRRGAKQRLTATCGFTTPHVSEYRLSRVTSSDSDNDRFIEGHSEDCSWPWIVGLYRDPDYRYRITEGHCNADTTTWLLEFVVKSFNGRILGTRESRVTWLWSWL